MPEYCIWTIGCQMNKADSDYVAAYLERAGYSPTPCAEKADFILVNSCVVRNSAEQKVLNKLGSLRGLKKRCPDVTIALTGCFVDSRIDDLKDRFPWVDLVFRPQQWEALFQWTESHGLPQFLHSCHCSRECLHPHHPGLQQLLLLLHRAIPQRQGKKQGPRGDLLSG